MNPPSQKLRQQAAEQVSADAAHTATTVGTVREFATPEEMIRHERRQTSVPAAVRKRLERSLAAEAAPVRKPWWKRLL